MGGHRLPLHASTLPEHLQLEARMHHWQRMFEMTNGKGFRQPPKNKRAKTYFQRLTEEFMTAA